MREVMRAPPSPEPPRGRAPAPAVYDQDTLREVANRFAVTGLDRAMVVRRSDPQDTVGEITVIDLLQARLRDHREEHHRERVFRPAPPLPRPLPHRLRFVARRSRV